jgi:hypothetical protein
MNAYKERSQSLDALAYPGYAAYLQSPEWAAIRMRILVRDNRRCISCGGAATEVHHRSYDEETMAGEVPWNLVSVCRQCHQHAEYDGARKRSIGEANELLGVGDTAICPICHEPSDWEGFWSPCGHLRRACEVCADWPSIVAWQERTGRNPCLIEPPPLPPAAPEPSNPPEAKPKRRTRQKAATPQSKDA